MLQLTIFLGNNLHSRKFNLSPHHLSLKSVLSPQFLLFQLTGSSQVDATNRFAQPGGDDIEDGRDNPYGNFFQVKLVFCHARGTSTDDHY